MLDIGQDKQFIVIRKTGIVDATDTEFTRPYLVLHEVGMKRVAATKAKENVGRHVCYKASFRVEVLTNFSTVDRVVCREVEIIYVLRNNEILGDV